MTMKLLTTQEVADHHGYSVDNAQRLARERDIKPAMVAGRSYLWNARDLKKFAPGPTGVHRVKKARGQ